MKKHRQTVPGYMPTPEQYMNALDSDPRHAVKRRRWSVKRVLLGLLLIIVLAAASYIGYIAVSVVSLSTNPWQLSGLSGDTNGRVNILVLGEGDPGHAGEGLTDTIMVLSLDRQTHRIAQISIPRDLRVNIEGYGYSKINAANAYGGIELAKSTVADTLGIPINYYARADFSGLRQIVDAVGGIDVNVTDRLYDSEYPCDANQYQVCGLDIEPGLQHMNGTVALQYARCRKGTCGNDYGRAARQQEVLDLIRAKVASPGFFLNPLSMRGLMAAAGTGIQTDMGPVQMSELVWDWQQYHANNPVKLVLSTSDGGYLISGGGSDLLPAGGSFDAIQERVANIFAN